MVGTYIMVGMRVRTGEICRSSYRSPYLELLKWVTQSGMTQPTTSWSLSESTQHNSLISEPQKNVSSSTHHGLVG